MTQTAGNIPAESDLLCERCGYRLNGLPPEGNCPECGQPAVASSPARRCLPAWEQSTAGTSQFIETTTAVLFHPERFYRSFATRQPRGKSHRFALIHLCIASLLGGAALFVHLDWFSYISTAARRLLILNAPFWGIVIYSAAAFLTLEATTRVAARLTSWEAGYRGLRLPLPVVLRGLDYHAAHYLPVALVSSITVIGYRWLVYNRYVTSLSDMKYLYILCGEVVAGAAYLFWTYWIGMRNMMYANA